MYPKIITLLVKSLIKQCQFPDFTIIARDKPIKKRKKSTTY